MESILFIHELFKSQELFRNQLSNHSNNQYHCHEFIEIFYVISGTAQQRLNNSTINISTGDLFLLRPSDQHSFASNDSSFIHRDFLIDPKQFQSICCFYNETFYDLILKNPSPPRIHLSQSHLSEVEAWFNRINIISNINIKNTMYSFLLSSILGHIFNNNISDLHTEPSIWINNLISQLNSPYNFATPLETLLEEIPYSRPYICRIFKQYTGTSPVKYFNNVRLSQAYLLIKSSTTSISKIAESLGFYHRSFFYKIFKEKYGISPSEVKKASARLDK